MDNLELKYRLSAIAPKPLTSSVKGLPLTSMEIDGNSRAIQEKVNEIISSVNFIQTYSDDYGLVTSLTTSTDDYGSVV